MLENLSRMTSPMRLSMIKMIEVVKNHRRTCQNCKMYKQSHMDPANSYQNPLIQANTAWVSSEKEGNLWQVTQQKWMSIIWVGVSSVWLKEPLVFNVQNKGRFLSWLLTTIATQKCRWADNTLKCGTPGNSNEKLYDQNKKYEVYNDTNSDSKTEIRKAI